MQKDLLASSSRLFSQKKSRPKSIFEIIQQSNDPLFIQYRQNNIEYDPELDSSIVKGILQP